MQTNQGKRVLIITYYWPPAGGPGVQRWLGFTNHLREFGIEPIVYAPENANYPIIDSTLVENIPSNLKVLNHPIKEPYRLASILSSSKSTEISKGIIPTKSRQSPMEKLLLFIRGNFFIPDARKSWIKPSIKYLAPKMRELRINTIITTGPPHSLHLIGKGLKEELGIKWIADFRDPWTTIGYHKELRLMDWAAERHRKLELTVLNQADQIVVTSFKTKVEFEGKTSTPIEIITNGYDSNDTKGQKDREFTLAHIGSLLSKRNPIVLWEVLRELIDENEELGKNFKLRLIGTTSQDVVDSLIRNGLEGHLEIIPYVEHQEALRFQKRSRVLLLIEINSKDTQGIIPGKLFEYMKSGTPIIAIGPENWDVEKILNETHSGFYFDYNSRVQLKQSIVTLFKAYKKNEDLLQPKGIEKYSRRNLTKQLAKLI